MIYMKPEVINMKNIKPSHKDCAAKVLVPQDQISNTLSSNQIIKTIEAVYNEYNHYIIPLMNWNNT